MGKAMATKAKKRFGTLVREKRKAKGISLRKFAGLVGVSALGGGDRLIANLLAVMPLVTLTLN